MNYYSLLAVVVLCFASPSIALAETWVELEGTFSAVSYDKDSVVRSGDSIRVLLKDTTTATDSSYYSAFLTLIELNCKDRTALAMSMHFLYRDGSRHKATPKTPDTRSPWLPGSNVDKVAKVLCPTWYEFWKR